MIHREWTGDGMDGCATFSDCERYRYRLSRHWGNGAGRVLFIMLNPSTATERVMDPTIRRCVGFAKAWGFAGLDVCNIFALRATDPAALYRESDPIGPDNDQWLATYASGVDGVICAWGVHGAHQGRGKQVLSRMLRYRPHHLGMTRGGHPKHPLYLRGNTVPEEWPGLLPREAPP